MLCLCPGGMCLSVSVLHAFVGQHVALAGACGWRPEAELSGSCSGAPAFVSPGDELPGTLQPQNAVFRVSFGHGVKRLKLIRAPHQLKMGMGRGFLSHALVSPLLNQGPAPSQLCYTLVPGFLSSYHHGLFLLHFPQP